MAETRIKVAIIGGGLAGTILMNALMKHPQLDVQIYEANAEIKERGASVGLSINAQRALHLLGLDDLTDSANAVTVGCLQLLVGEGPDAGQLIYDLDFGKKTVHRAALLKELLAPIPNDKIRLNKRMSCINRTTISFADGSSVDVDVIIGADGIHSGVREYVLGEGHPNISPVPSGFWDAREIVSYEEAVSAFGHSCINSEDPHQHIHIGGKGVLFHDFIDDGKKICIVATGPVPSSWDVSQWRQTVSRDWLNGQFAGWGDFGQKGLDLLMGDKNEVPAFIQWESAQAPTLYNGSICMIGDAAHATSPWMGTGLSQAIEDVLIIDRVLGRCKNAQQVPLAFHAYDEVRRAHAQKVIESSRKAAEAYFSAHAGGVKQLRKDIPSREYILNWDTEGAIEKAVKLFEQLRKANGCA